MRTARTGESVLVDDEVFYRLDGSSFPVEYRAHPVRRNGVLEGALCTFTDISTRRQHMATLRELNETLEQRVVEEIGRRADAENALRQAQKMEAIGQLTGGIAHDFNNVLQVIGGNMQLLQSQLAGNQAAQKRLDTAVAAVLRGAKLSSQLLAFARRQPLQPVVINLGELVHNTDDLLRRALGEAVIVKTVVEPDLWNTLADPGQIENVILNLAINARDAMQGEGRLTLELANATLDDQSFGAADAVPAGDYVMLAVSDTGSGMSPITNTSYLNPGGSFTPCSAFARAVSAGAAVGSGSSARTPTITAASHTNPSHHTLFIRRARRLGETPGEARGQRTGLATAPPSLQTRS